MNSSDANDLSGLLRLPNLKVERTYEEREENETTTGLLVRHRLIIVVRSVTPAIKSPCCLVGIRKNGTKSMRFRDFAVQKQETWLEIKRQRFNCGLCGATHYEALPDVDTDFLMTKRFRQAIERDAVDDTFAKAEKDNAVEVSTTKRIFYAYAKPIIDHYLPDMPEVLGMDEKWLYKAPKFVISNVESTRLLDMQLSRRKIDLRKYFDTLPNRHRVKVVCQDMWRPYKQLTPPYFPNAATVIDKFHVQKLSDLAVNHIRKKVQRELDDEGRKSLKGRIGLLQSRWPPKETKQSIKEGKTPKLDETHRIFELYPRIKQVYFLREGFYDIYLAADRQEGLDRYTAWKGGLPEEFELAFKPCLSAFNGWQPFILNHFGHRYTSAIVERLNGLAAKMNTNASGMSFDMIRAKMLLKYGVVKDERQELRYAHERRESDAQFWRIEKKLMEAAYLNRPGMTGRVIGYGMDLSTLEAAFETDWL